MRPWMMMMGLTLVACDADPDGDGLTNREERELGSLPDVADSDGDGLDDGVEFELGTDPLQSDSDGDGYLDFDEVAEGSDPVDAESLIYAGGWPYYRGKDALSDPGTKGSLAAGEQVGRFLGVDQYGDMVDLYDLAGSDVPIVLDVSAMWCPPCNDLSDWLSHGNDHLDSSWPGVRRAVRRGDIRWVTFMMQDFDRAPATQENCEEWDEAYPHKRIPVIADPDAEMARHLQATGLPALRLIESDLTLSSLGDAPYWDVLTELADRL